jgi:hypothetical protein
MPRPVTLFSGQWADLTFDTLCAKAKSFGYDGVEIACSNDHFEVDKALEQDGYLQGRWDILHKHGLKCFAISNHLVGQAVCDRIDERHAAILPPRIFGDGKEDGVRARAAEEMKNTARRRGGLWRQGGARLHRFAHLAHGLFVPAQPARFPGEGAGALCRALDAGAGCLPGSGHQVRAGGAPHGDRVRHRQRAECAGCGKHHPAFGFNYDPSHFGYQGVDYVAFIRKFADRIFHAHMKDVYWRRARPKPASLAAT